MLLLQSQAGVSHVPDKVIFLVIVVCVLLRVCRSPVKRAV